MRRDENENSLDAKLQNIQAALNSAQAGDITSACNQIKAVLGCPQPDQDQEVF